MNISDKNKLFDLVCFVFGAFLLIFSILNYDEKILKILIAAERTPMLFYPLWAKIGISIGAALICLGFLMRNWRKKKIIDKASINIGSEIIH